MGDLSRPQIRIQTKRSPDQDPDPEMIVLRGEKCAQRKVVRNILHLILKRRKNQKLNENPKKDPQRQKKAKRKRMNQRKVKLAAMILLEKKSLTTVLMKISLVTTKTEHVWKK